MTNKSVIFHMMYLKHSHYSTQSKTYQLPSVSELRLRIPVEKIRQQINVIEPMNSRIKCENYNDDETNNIMELLEDTKWNLLQQQEDLNEMRSDIQHFDFEWTNMVNTLARNWGSRPGRSEHLFTMLFAF